MADPRIVRHLRLMRTSRDLALALGVFATVGCYNYQPISPSEIAPSTNVRLRLSGDAVERLRSGTNNEARLLDDFSVSGSVMRLNSDSLVLSVESSHSSDAMTRPVTFFQPIALLRSDVRAADVRRLDRKRTTITVVVLSALVLGAATYAILHGGEASGSTPVPGGPNELRVPSLSR